jgi:hypothetical protein
MDEIDRNLNSLDEDGHRLLDTDHLEKAYRLMLDHAPEGPTDAVRQALYAVGAYGRWAATHHNAVGIVAGDHTNHVKGPMREARAVLKNMEMAIGKPDAKPFQWS